LIGALRPISIRNQKDWRHLPPKNMARRQFDLIVFDWDGTLMDSTATIVTSRGYVASLQDAIDQAGL